MMDLRALVPVAFLLIVSCLASPATADWYGPLAVYCGRHKEEGTLKEACDTGRYNTVIITFYSVFGYQYGLDLSGHDASTVGADIRYCQSKGVSIFLSIGGQYSLPLLPIGCDLSS